MEKKLLFKILDVVLMILFFIPVLIPQKIDPYISIWFAIIIFFALLGYFAVRSEITKLPFWSMSWKKSVVNLTCLIAMFLIDILVNRFGDYPSLMTFELLTVIMAGEIYDTYFTKKRV